MTSFVPVPANYTRRDWRTKQRKITTKRQVTNNPDTGTSPLEAYLSPLPLPTPFLGVPLRPFDTSGPAHNCRKCVKTQVTAAFLTSRLLCLTPHFPAGFLIHPQVLHTYSHRLAIYSQQLQSLVRSTSLGVLLNCF